MIAAWTGSTTSRNNVLRKSVTFPVSIIKQREDRSREYFGRITTKPITQGGRPPGEPLRALSQSLTERFPAGLLYRSRPTEVGLLAVDPEHIHLYWHVPDWSDADWVIRLHDLAYMDVSGANPHASIDLPVTEPDAQRYLHIAGGDKTLQVQLGIRGAYHRLEVMAESVPVRLPPLPVRRPQLEREKTFPLISHEMAEALRGLTLPRQVQPLVMSTSDVEAYQLPQAVVRPSSLSVVWG